MISSITQGSGFPVVLLHGFCESRLIWKYIQPYLPAGYQFIIPDIPGFGESPLHHNNITLREVAHSLRLWLKENEVKEFAVIGHSMGGYIGLELASQAGDSCKAICLFHSTAEADSEEKKQNRLKSVEFVQKNGKEAFLKTFIPGLYHKKGAWEKDVLAIVFETSEKSISCFTLAMRDRNPHLDFIKSYQGNMLFIAGEMDSFIPAESLRQQATIPKNSVFELMKETGHLGMVEAPEEAAAIVKEFLSQISY